MNKGLTTPNRQWDDWTAAEIAGLNDLAPDAIVWIVYDLAFEQSRNHKAVIQSYRASHPGTRVLVRPYAEHILELNPKDWAIECARRLDWTGILTAEMIPGNEFNLEGGQYAEDWNFQCSWLVSWAGAWQDLHRINLTHLPALSPNGDYKAGWAAYIRQEIPLYFDGTDWHFYTLDQLGDFDALPRSPGQSVSLTEFNQVSPTLMFDAVKNLVDDAVWFICGGTPDQAQYDILKQPANYQAFKFWTQGDSPVADPTIAELVAKVDQVEKQFGLTVEALKALANGEYRGASGVDGKIVALQGGASFTGSFEPAPKA